MNFEKINTLNLLQKYELPKKYFICSNQFWAHKNHITVLKAIKILKKDNVRCHIVFTGSTRDYRNPDFYQSLLEYVKKEQLDKYVSFLGFIDRKEQLKLMKEAVAVIQPSLFEGWGTVVEDAKSMNKYIILSDIAVHKEQCSENVIFFEPNTPNQLSEIIRKFISEKPKVKTIDYQKNQINFAETFIKILKGVGINYNK
ncbi:MAG: glycosyltransferase [Bacteroidales bacterium]|nr:glycosyltransferase [Bacteroidales bacterium]